MRARDDDDRQRRQLAQRGERPVADGTTDIVGVEEVAGDDERIGARFDGDLPETRNDPA